MADKEFNILASFPLYVNSNLSDSVDYEWAIFFSLKGQIINIFSFLSPMVSLATTQLCYYSTKAATANM